jgi:hypothetical protein
VASAIDELAQTAWDHYWKVKQFALEADLRQLGQLIDEESPSATRSPESWRATCEYWLLRSHLRFTVMETDEGMRALQQAEAAAVSSGDPRCLPAVRAHAAERALMDGRMQDARGALRRALDEARDPSQNDGQISGDQAVALMALRGRLTVLEATASARDQQPQKETLGLLGRADLIAQQIGVERRVLGCAFGPMQLKADTIYILQILGMPEQAMDLAMRVQDSALAELRRAQFYADCGLACSDLSDLEREAEYMDRATALIPEMLERQPAPQPQPAAS